MRQHLEAGFGELPCGLVDVIDAEGDAHVAGDAMADLHLVDVGRVPGVGQFQGGAAGIEDGDATPRGGHGVDLRHSEDVAIDMQGLVEVRGGDDEAELMDWWWVHRMLREVLRHNGSFRTRCTLTLRHGVSTCGGVVQREPRSTAFGAVAAHELRHDVGRARALLAALCADLPPESVHQRDAASLADLLARMQVSVDALLVGDADRAERAPTHLGELIHRVARAHDPAETVIDVRVPSLVMNVDPVKLERIIDNLLANALAHAPAGTTVPVEARFTRGMVTLLVADEGPGIPEEVVRRLERAGDEPAMPGGLDVVARFARAHGGRVWATGPGAQVYVELPTSDDPDSGPEPAISR